jgi:hypothetical protein
MINFCVDCGLSHDGPCEDDALVLLNKPLREDQIVDLLDMPGHVVFSPDAFKITNVDVPFFLPDGTIVGKARVVEGDDEDAVLIEVETTNPIVANLFKADIIGLSLVYREASPQDTAIEEVKIN